MRLEVKSARGRTSKFGTVMVLETHPETGKYLLVVRFVRAVPQRLGLSAIPRIEIENGAVIHSRCAYSLRPECAQPDTERPTDAHFRA